MIGRNSGSYRAEGIGFALGSRLPAPGSRLPGEILLSQEYGVGSNTVRRALGILRERKLVVTVRARGSFVVEELPDASDG
ncbi:MULTISPECIES: GntR family transcriptional regulator [Streptomyces]|uniref:GntR family transcriptional regulator n=1 Tax=Streptomyces TaxID=1883 RepID=UPI0009988BD7|nr:MULTISPECIES: GntR family transcriptional regulator [Streptomyces]